jgi:putative acetyltransferase
VEVDDPRAEDIRELLATHLEFSRGVTPAEYSFALDVEQLVNDDVTFFSARESGRLLGVAALKRLDETHAELKSMHTLGTERRKGVGRALVLRIVAVARERGFRRLSLETGSTEEFQPARSLYESLGFRSCEPYGDYLASPYNTFMTIALEDDHDPVS